MCDGQFLLYQDVFEQTPLYMLMSVPPANAHVPMAERNNRVIQERARALYHHSGRVLRPGRVVPLPITDTAIARVEAMGMTQHMKSFKIKNCHKELIYDSDWIAGVDYEDQNIYEDDDDSD